MAEKKGKGRYSFLETNDMSRPKAAIWFSVLSAILLVVDLLVSWAMEGSAPLFFGAAGLVGALSALYALIIALIALSRREARYRTCVAAALFSGIMAILWLTVFLSGLQ